MNLKHQDKRLIASDLTELSAASAAKFRDGVRAALAENETTLDVDMSSTNFLDSSGLGALIALHKTMASRQGCLRILNPTPMAQQILELTRMHRIFEIVKT